MANVPAVLVAMDDVRRNIDPATADGIYGRVLAKTGDADLAEKMKTEFKVQQTLANLPAMQK